MPCPFCAPCRPTSRTWMWTPSSTPPTAHCWAAAGWMAPSTAPPGPSCWRPAARWAAARRAKKKITPGFRLPARYVIHTVGPVWHGGGAGEPALLAACYRRSIALALAHGGCSLAFPGISTGVYGYPAALAARVAVAAVRSALPTGSPLREVIFCCFSKHGLAVYQTVLQERPPSAPGHRH